jgi:hypothetical protein
MKQRKRKKRELRRRKKRRGFKTEESLFNLRLKLGIQHLRHLQALPLYSMILKAVDLSIRFSNND